MFLGTGKTSIDMFFAMAINNLRPAEDSYFLFLLKPKNKQRVKVCTVIGSSQLHCNKTGC